MGKDKKKTKVATGSKKGSKKAEKKTKVALGSKWNKVNTPPAPNPDIILVFHGLMAVSQQNRNKVEFICHGIEQRHSLRILVGKKLANGSFSLVNTVNPTSRNISFSTNNTGSEIKVYNNQAFGDKSFDWIIDVEKEHGKRLEKKRGTHPHKISINDGILYTYARTSAKFELKDERNVTQMPPREVAAILAINIYLQTGKEGTLTEYAMPFQKQAEPHVVIFDNDCREENGMPCKNIFNSPSYKLRNDFYLNYENIADKKRSNVSELFLILTSEGNQVVLFGECDVRPDLGLETKTKDREENRAPCTATGYGETGGGG